MSLTNPKDVVTEERLSEFYQGIYPYLGGMPEILANKFSRSDIYSTTEKMIGQWTDGKPLYQKSFSVSKSVSSDATVTLFTHTGCDYVDIAKSEFIRSSDSTVYTLPNATCVLKIKSNGEVQANAASGATYNGIWKITLQYTKTTDSAISIGVDTDYSTTEKIVGTWIDGKYLYQKVVTTNTAVPSGATLIHREAMASTGYDTIQYTKTS